MPADTMLATVVRVVEALGSARDAADVPAVTARAHTAIDALRPLATAPGSRPPAAPPGHA